MYLLQYVKFNKRSTNFICYTVQIIIQVLKIVTADTQYWAWSKSQEISFNGLSLSNILAYLNNLQISWKNSVFLLSLFLRKSGEWKHSLFTINPTTTVDNCYVTHLCPNCVRIVRIPPGYLWNTFRKQRVCTSLVLQIGLWSCTSLWYCISHNILKSYPKNIKVIKMYYVCNNNSKAHAIISVKVPAKAITIFYNFLFFHTCFQFFFFLTLVGSVSFSRISFFSWVLIIS